jgi:hypothetical protein
MEANTNTTATNDAPVVQPDSNTDTTGDTPSNAAKPGGTLVTREAFLSRAKGKDARPVHRVELPWLGDGMHVYVRGMGARQRDAFEDAITQVKNGKVIVTNDNVRARVIVQCACDANGERIFEDSDENVVGELDARTADAIYAKASRISGITQQDVDELVKN